MEVLSKGSQLRALITFYVNPDPFYDYEAEKPLSCLVCHFLSDLSLPALIAQGEAPSIANIQSMF